MSKSLTLMPRLSEKTHGLSQARVYVVDVPAGANKHAIARAVKAQFDVEVANVNTTNIQGKSKRIRSLSGKRHLYRQGQRSDVKKAYVTLAEGHSLPFFAAIEEEAAKEEKTRGQMEKAAEKQASKEIKKGSKPRLSLHRKKKDEE